MAWYLRGLLTDASGSVRLERFEWQRDALTRAAELFDQFGSRCGSNLHLLRTVCQFEITSGCPLGIGLEGNFPRSANQATPRMGHHRRRRALLGIAGVCEGVQASPYPRTLAHSLDLGPLIQSHASSSV